MWQGTNVKVQIKWNQTASSDDVSAPKGMRIVQLQLSDCNNNKMSTQTQCQGSKADEHSDQKLITTGV